MPLGTATITYDLADMLGVDFDARRTKVWVTTNVPSETVVDTDANKIRLGSGNGTIADDGTGSVTVWTPGTGANPASWQTYIHVAYPDRNTPRGRAQRTFGPFTITAPADLADLVEQQEMPPEYIVTVTSALSPLVGSAQAAATTAAASATSAAASAAAAQAIVLSDADPKVEALVNDPTSATRAALSTVISDQTGEVIANEIARADAAYAENPDLLWIPASDFWPLVGSEELGYGGTATPHVSYGWALADEASDFNHSEGVSYMLKLPSAWASVTIDVYWTPLTTAGGNAAWNGTVYNIDFGGAFDSGSTGNLGFANTAASTTANRLKVTALPTPGTVDPDKLSRIKLVRNATSSTDTIVGDVLFVGALVRRVA